MLRSRGLEQGPPIKPAVAHSLRNRPAHHRGGLLICTCVCGAASGHDDDHCVLKGRLCHDVAGLDVLLHQLKQVPAGQAGRQHVGGTAGAQASQFE